jgi:hypothetical protein
MIQALDFKRERVRRLMFSKKVRWAAADLISEKRPSA